MLGSILHLKSWAAGHPLSLYDSLVLQHLGMWGFFSYLAPSPNLNFKSGANDFLPVVQRHLGPKILCFSKLQAQLLELLSHLHCLLFLAHLEVIQHRGKCCGPLKTICHGMANWAVFKIPDITIPHILGSIIHYNHQLTEVLNTAQLRIRPFQHPQFCRGQPCPERRNVRPLFQRQLPL